MRLFFAIEKANRDTGEGELFAHFIFQESGIAFSHVLRQIAEKGECHTFAW
jgi:hypothetical protein